MLKAEGLKKSFGDKPVLDAVSLEIEDGCAVGVVGPSGIGKSTLAKLLCGLIKADAGEAQLDGKPLFSHSRRYDRSLGTGVQMVWQQPYSSLDPSQIAAKGLRELIRCRRLAPRGEAEDALIEQLAAEVGLDMRVLAQLPHQLSGGEAQRVALARCLLLKPRLLILDEATSMLDVSTQANVLALVKKNMSGGGVLLISHDEALTERFCGKIYVLDSLKLKEKK